MASSKNKNRADRRKRSILGILLVLLAFLILASLATHTATDDDTLLAEGNPFQSNFQNSVGTAGAYSSYLLIFFFGWLAFFLPLILIYVSLMLFSFDWRRKARPALWCSLIISILATMVANVTLLGDSATQYDFTDTSGGYIFHYLTRFLMQATGGVGSFILLSAGILITAVVLAYSYLSESSRMDFLKALNPLRLIKWAAIKAYELLKSIFRVMKPRKKEKKKKVRSEKDTDLEPILPAEGEIDVGDIPDSERVDTATEGKKARQKITLKQKPARIGQEVGDYKFPGLELLNDNPDEGVSVDPEELAMTAQALKETLETFGVTIDGNIDKYPGPVITRFEFKPAAGVKVHQITNLSDDLALALRAKRIRIIAPIPGKAAVGVEIPNHKARTVFLKEIINSDIYTDGRIRLPLALGKTISGKPFVADLARMPHLLIAGATGSGKSVCINALITSLLYRLHPKQLKFIFIDPKMLELSVYSGLPFLARPVVTNPKRAEKVLADAVAEMEGRYKKLAGQSVRNIEDYNARQKDPEEKMPYIVIIVDELADMMIASASSRIEMLITRLAQMARAVGIHLVLATQRPSVDVITGLIKANFSARIAFQVASKIDSRTILDGNGAEKLLGNGDMLFLQPGQPEPVRIHGGFISSEETDRIVKFINAQFPTAEKVEGEKPEETSADSDEDDVDLDDPLFLEAAETVIRHKQGSVSLLQRKLGIGYQRAARLIDKLEEAGVVSAYDGSKAREVLVDRTYLERLSSSRSLTDKN